MTAERRRERVFRDHVETLLLLQARNLDVKSLNTLDDILDTVLSVRGFGHVKKAAMDQAMARLDDLSGQHKENQNLQICKNL